MYFRKNLLKIIVFAIILSFIILSMTGVTVADTKIDISKPVELKWFVIGEGDQPDISLVEDSVNKYIKDKINATIILKTFGWDIYQQKMALMIAAGEPFDMCFTSNWSVYYPYASMGVFTDLTDMLDTYAPKTKALLGKNILKGAEVNGRVYAIPSYQKNITNSYGLLFNKSLVNKYKINVSKIKKLADLEPIFKSVKAKSPKVIDFYPLDTTGKYSVFSTLNYNELTGLKLPGSVEIYGKNTKVVNQYDTPTAKSLFSLMNKWYKKGYISKSSKDQDFFKKNQNNILAFYSLLDPFIQEDLHDYNNLEVLPVELSKPFISSNSVTSFMQGISATSLNPERALMFLELVNTDEKLANMVNYGIEGTHFEIIGAKTIDFLPDANKYIPSAGPIFGNSSILYQISDYTPKNWDRLDKSVKNAAISPLLGFNFNSQYVVNQLNKLEEIINKYYTDLSIGKIDPAVYLPKMNKEFKNAGLQKVLTEMQKQVDVFVKAKNK